MHVPVCVAPFILVGLYYTCAYRTHFVMDYIVTCILCMYHAVGHVYGCMYVGQALSMRISKWNVSFFRGVFNQLAVWSAFISGLVSVLHSVSLFLPIGPALLISFVYVKIIV